MKLIAIFLLFISCVCYTQNIDDYKILIDFINSKKFKNIVRKEFYKVEYGQCWLSGYFREDAKCSREIFKTIKKGQTFNYHAIDLRKKFKNKYYFNYSNKKVERCFQNLSEDEINILNECINNQIIEEYDSLFIAKENEFCLPISFYRKVDNFFHVAIQISAVYYNILILFRDDKFIGYCVKTQNSTL